jgi:hypothetical protein
VTPARRGVGHRGKRAGIPFRTVAAAAPNHRTSSHVLPTPRTPDATLLPRGEVLGPTDQPRVPRPSEAPRPGDPRAGGPRPSAGPRDLLWAGLAGALVVLTVVQLVGLTIAVVRLETAPSGGGFVLGFLITVVWLLTIYWLVMGAWRRSVWGCPFDHDADAAASRRCQRHAGAPRRPGR